MGQQRLLSLSPIELLVVVIQYVLPIIFIESMVSGFVLYVYPSCVAYCLSLPIMRDITTAFVSPGGMGNL